VTSDIYLVSKMGQTINVQRPVSSAPIRHFYYSSSKPKPNPKPKPSHEE